MAHLKAADVLHTYVELNRSAEWVADIDFTDAAAATAAVATEFDGGGADAHRADHRRRDRADPARMIYTLPDGHRWDRVPEVTLLGTPRT